MTLHPRRIKRDIHHLVYASVTAKKPVYCGASYEEAQASSTVLRRPVIALFVSGEFKCPLCRT